MLTSEEPILKPKLGGKPPKYVSPFEQQAMRAAEESVKPVMGGRAAETTAPTTEDIFRVAPEILASDKPMPKTVQDVLLPGKVESEVSRLEGVLKRLTEPFKETRGSARQGFDKGDVEALGKVAKKTGRAVPAATRILNRYKAKSHELTRRMNMSDEAFRDIKLELTGKESMKDMGQSEARAVTQRLQKDLEATTKSVRKLKNIVKRGDMTEDDLVHVARDLTGREVRSIADVPADEIRMIEELLTTPIAQLENVNWAQGVRAIRSQLHTSGVADEALRVEADIRAFRAHYAEQFGKIVGPKRIKDRKFMHRMGAYLDGQPPPIGNPWTDDELRIFRGVRNMLDDLHHEFGFSEDRYIKNFLPHIWETRTSLTGMVQDVSRSLGGGELTAKELGRVIPEELFFAHELQRRGAGGYTFDAAKALDAYIYHGSKKKFWQPFLDKWRPTVMESKHLTKRSRDFYRDWFESLMGGDNSAQRFWINFYDVLRKKGIPVPETFDGRVMSNWFRESMYAGALGFKPSFALRNLTQQLHTIGEVNQRWWANGWRLWHQQFVDDEVKALLNEARPRLLREYQPGMARGGEKVFDPKRLTSWNEKYMGGAMWFVRESDKVNRQVSFLAGYSKFMSKKGKINFAGFRPADARRIKGLMGQGKVRDAAIDYGLTVSDNTQWVYSAVNRPPYFRKGAGKYLGVFMTWPSNYADWLIRQATNTQGLKGLFSVAGKGKLANYVLSTMALVYGGHKFLDIDISKWYLFNALPSDLPLAGTLMKGGYDAAMGAGKYGFTYATTGGEGDTRYSERQMKGGARKVWQSAPAVGYGGKLPALATRDIFRTKAAYEQVGAGEAAKELFHLGTTKYDRRFTGDEMLPGPFTFTLPEYRKKEDKRRRRKRQRRTRAERR
jgi:phage terminase Nu1 subunit (DNA packaging protein)